MVTANLAPIKQALVRAIRANATLKAALTGGIHEGFAPPKSRHPFLTYSVHYAPVNYLWGSMMLEIGFDVFVFSEDSVEADNLDALVFTTLHDAELQVSEQSTLICRRTSSLSLPDSNEEGKKIYQVGGIYEVWTDQPLPLETRNSLSADALIS
jgi:hypothetical protein